MTTPKKTKGRQKIEMAKIVNQKSLAVTFSKRQSGLFSKADELCTLCGAELVIIILSPTKKPFSFGEPSVKEIIKCYLEQRPPPSASISRYMDSYRNANIQVLNTALINMNAKLDVARKIGEQLDIIKRARQERNWWEAPINTLNGDQSENVKVGLLELRKKCEKEAERRMVKAANTTTPIIYGSGVGSSGVDDVGTSKSWPMDLHLP